MGGTVDTHYGPAWLSAYFEDGDIGTIKIKLETYLWTHCDTYPISQHNSKSATIILFSCGLIGSAGLRRKSKKR